MTQREEMLKKRLEKALFCMWIYEKHSKRMPTDMLTLQLYEDYKKRCIELINEYITVYGEGYSGQYIWQSDYLLKGTNDERVYNQP